MSIRVARRIGDTEDVETDDAALLLSHFYVIIERVILILCL